MSASDERRSSFTPFDPRCSREVLARSDTVQNLVYRDAIASIVLQCISSGCSLRLIGSAAGLYGKVSVRIVCPVPRKGREGSRGVRTRRSVSRIERDRRLVRSRYG